MKKITQFATTFFFVALMCQLLNSCSYYEVKSFQRSNKPLMVEQLSKAQTMQRYFVVHAPNDIYALNLATVDSVSGILSGTIDSVASDHQLYIQHLKTDTSNMKYKASKPEEVQVLNEIHVFTDHFMHLPPGSEFNLAIDSIKEVKVIDKNKTRTTLSYVLGIGIPVALITTLIITLSSVTLFYFSEPII
jgi:hypothetical protein